MATKADTANRLYRVIKDGDLTSLYWLLCSRPSLANFSPQGCISSPLMHAALEGSVDAVVMLLRFGADANIVDTSAKGATYNLAPLEAALWFEHDEVAERLLSAGAYWSFGASIFARRVREVLDVIDEKPELLGTRKLRPAATLLHLCAIIGHDELAVELIDRGLGVDDISDGHAPLYYAARGAHVDVCETLLNAGADVDQHNAKGLSALTQACRERCDGALQTVELLLRRGANPNGITAAERSPLQRAIGARSEKTCHALLDHGADPHRHGPDGLSSYAQAKGLTTVVNRLEAQRRRSPTKRA